MMQISRRSWGLVDRAFVESAAGHFLIVAAFVLFVILSQRWQPVHPAEPAQASLTFYVPHTAPEETTVSTPPDEHADAVPVDNSSPLDEVVGQTKTASVRNVSVQQAQPKRKHVVHVTTNRASIVQRAAARPPTVNTPVQPAIDAKQLAEAIGQGIAVTPLHTQPQNSGVSDNTGGSAAASVMDAYKAALKIRLYNEWAKPPGADGLTTLIHIRIAADGSVLSDDVTRSAGHAAMDNSAERAIHAVRPAPLPPGVSAPYELDIAFESTGSVDR